MGKQLSKSEMIIERQQLRGLIKQVEKVGTLTVQDQMMDCRCKEKGRGPCQIRQFFPCGVLVCNDLSDSS